MRVLLIQPPEHNMITTNVPSVVDEESGIYPPLGLLYVASFAEQGTSSQIEVLDCPAERFSYEQLEDEIRKRKPDLVGIQATTFTLIDTIITAKTVKRIDTAIQVVIGGPHVFIYPEETLQIPEVDFIIRGEAEESFSGLIEAIGGNGDLNNINGLGYKKNGIVHLNDCPPLIEDLDRLPMPARHLVPQDRYYSVLAKRNPITTMMTSRGCPMKCIYCDRPHLGKKFRYRSAESVIKEMQLCSDMGIGEIFVYDDTFSIRKDRVLDICRAIIENKINISWDIRAHINTIDEEVLEALAGAGCSRIHYGVESGNQDILKLIKKGIKLDRTKEVFQMTRDHGISTLGYFMIGFPDETPEQIEDTLKFACSIAADFVHIAITTPFPSTELYRWGLQNGFYDHDFWQKFARDPQPGFAPRVWDQILSREELIEIMRSGYKRFYMRPGYLIKRMLAVGSFEEFYRKAKAGVRLLRWKKM